MDLNFLQEAAAGLALPESTHEEPRQAGSEAEESWELEDQQWRQISFQPYGDRWKMRVQEILEHDWGDTVRVQLEQTV